MNKEIKNFGNMEIEKLKLCYCKYHIDKLKEHRICEFGQIFFKFRTI